MRVSSRLCLALLLSFGCHEAPPEIDLEYVDPLAVCEVGVERDVFLADHLPDFCAWLVSCPDLDHVSVDACVAHFTERFTSTEPPVSVTDDGEPCWDACRAALCVDVLADLPVCESSAQAAGGTWPSVCMEMRRCPPRRRE